MKTYYVILKNNKPIGLDSSSGGYWWLPSHPSQVKYFDKHEDAVSYKNTFSTHSNENSAAPGSLKSAKIVQFIFPFDLFRIEQRVGENPEEFRDDYESKS